MKALEILRKERLFVTHIDNVSIDEAIAELEALQDEVKDAEWRLDLYLAQQRAMQEHKTCDGCTYEKCELDTPLHDLYCANCSRIHVDNYEPKEQS